MAAPIVSIHPEEPQPRVMERALAVLQGDGLLAYPTDTSYAYGCSMRSRKAVQRLQQLKRDAKKPLALICPDLSDVAHFARVSNFAYRILRRNTPGPFVFVLEATRLVPDLMMNRQKQVGIRIPDLELPRLLAQRLGNPLVTTTAADVEGEPLRDPRDIKAAEPDGVALILDSGISGGALSTVVSLIEDEVQVLREGSGELDVR